MIYPPDFTFPDRKADTAQYAATSIAGLAPARRTVVQAGGCAGLWPMALAAHFEHVYTFEPEPTNFACLRQNVATLQNVYAYDYALSDRRGMTGLDRPKQGAGLWHLSGEGHIPVVTLDEFLGDLPACDALVLDVEGSEPAVLRGAERLIASHRPVLWVEFLRNTTEIEGVLAAYGYTRPARGVGGDCYSVHTSRAH